MVVVDVDEAGLRWCTGHAGVVAVPGDVSVPRVRATSSALSRSVAPESAGSGAGGCAATGDVRRRIGISCCVTASPSLADATSMVEVRLPAALLHNREFVVEAKFAAGDRAGQFRVTPTRPDPAALCPAVRAA